MSKVITHIGMTDIITGMQWVNFTTHYSICKWYLKTNDLLHTKNSAECYTVHTTCPAAAQ